MDVILLDAPRWTYERRLRAPVSCDAWRPRLGAWAHVRNVGRTVAACVQGRARPVLVTVREERCREKAMVLGM